MNARSDVLTACKRATPGHAALPKTWWPEHMAEVLAAVGRSVDEYELVREASGVQVWVPKKRPHNPPGREAIFQGGSDV